MPLTRKEKNELELFGLNLRQLRKEKGFTQEKLAEIADLHPRAVQKIEAGDVNATVTTILRLQKSLGCSWENLFTKSNKS